MKNNRTYTIVVLHSLESGDEQQESCKTLTDFLENGWFIMDKTICQSRVYFILQKYSEFNIDKLPLSLKEGLKVEKARGWKTITK